MNKIAYEHMVGMVLGTKEVMSKEAAPKLPNPITNMIRRGGYWLGEQYNKLIPQGQLFGRKRVFTPDVRNSIKSIRTQKRIDYNRYKRLDDAINNVESKLPTRTSVINPNIQPIIDKMRTANTPIALNNTTMLSAFKDIRKFMDDKDFNNLYGHYHNRRTQRYILGNMDDVPENIRRRYDNRVVK